MEISIVISLLAFAGRSSELWEHHGSQHTEPEADLCHNGKSGYVWQADTKASCERRNAVCLFLHSSYSDGRYADHLYMLPGCELYRDTLFSSGAALAMQRSAGPDPMCGSSLTFLQKASEESFYCGKVTGV